MTPDLEALFYCIWSEDEHGEYTTSCGVNMGNGTGWLSEEPEFCKECGRPVRMLPYYEMEEQ